MSGYFVGHSIVPWWS